MGVNTSGGHPAMDYAEHTRTYANFLAWSKVLIVFLVVLLSGMAYFLV
ncbi:aa3-type cytochrome c oxidase subunit IV [Hyphomicrobium sp.]|nr:aa3-type cytochrome c oxidase subunit IV [Hyphomicrobium sp.]HEX2842916.1 aa3-type cytochrome c oxidase subunit IV [Hyphomicrobium sp.]